MAPFRPEHHDLGACGSSRLMLALEPLPADAADDLGAAFANLDPWARYPYPASQLATYFGSGEPRAPRFAIYADREIAGVAGLRLDWLRGPYVQFLGLLPAFQGRGLGSAVLRWVETEARSAAERNLWVCASDFNTGALAFYERHGFARVAILDGLVRDDRAELLLRKRL